MTHSPTTLLRCARLAYPQLEWRITSDDKIFAPEPEYYFNFNPHDPTKGDLAALNEALERAGRQFWHNGVEFGAAYSKVDIYIYSATPVERAIRCVEAMEPNGGDA